MNPSRMEYNESRNVLVILDVNSEVIAFFGERPVGLSPVPELVAIL